VVPGGVRWGWGGGVGGVAGGGGTCGDEGPEPLGGLLQPQLDLHHAVREVHHLLGRQRRPARAGQGSRWWAREIGPCEVSLERRVEIRVVSGAGRLWHSGAGTCRASVLPYDFASTVPLERLCTSGGGRQAALGRSWAAKNATRIYDIFVSEPPNQGLTACGRV